MEDLIKHQREIEEAPDTMIINGVEYRKVVPEKEELTLTDLIKRWERQFWFKWKNKENQNYDLYNREIGRLVQMIEGWLPPEKDLNVYQAINNCENLYAVDFGWNEYRRRLLGKFR